MPDLPIRLVGDFLPSHSDLLATLDADFAWEERVEKTKDGTIAQFVYDPECDDQVEHCMTSQNLPTESTGQ